MDSGLITLPLPDLKAFYEADVLRAKAEGQSHREAAKTAGVCTRTVTRTVERHREWLDEALRETQKVLASEVHAIARGRAQAALDPENRNGAQSAYWCSDVLGWTGKGDMHVHGDVNISAEVIDARRQCLSVDPAELAALRERYGA